MITRQTSKIFVSSEADESPVRTEKKKRKYPRVFKEKRTTETTELYSQVITSCERMQNIRAQDDTALYERRS